jgi:myo-inositol-1(or 4)-monophosphatase
MLDDLLRTAREAADAAASVHSQFVRDPAVLRTREKGQSDFVSEADLEAQRIALAIIAAGDPDPQVLAEEEDGPGEAIRSVAEARPDAPLWIVDPLDGTTNFLHGHPMHCASVGVLLGGRCVVGAVTSAATGEHWWAAQGSGAFLNGDPIHVSATRDMRQALIGTGFPFKALPRLPEFLGQMDRVLRGTAGIRRLGSAAMDLCYLASGRLDGFWELDLGPWDVAGGIAILEEAGGLMTDLDGGALDLASPKGFLGANDPHIHDRLGDLVRG